MCKAIRLLIYSFVVMTVVFTSIPTQHRSDGVAYAQGAFGRRATGSSDNSDNSNQAAEEAKKREEEAKKAEEEKKRQEEEARQAAIRRREEEERRAAEEKHAQEVRDAELRRQQEARDAEVRRQQEERDAEARRQQEARDAENRRKEQEARDTENRRREQEARDAENRRRDQEARDAEARDAATRRDREEAARQDALRRRDAEERRANDEARVAAARRADEERRAAEAAARRPVDVTPTDRNEHRHGDPSKYERVGERPKPPVYHPEHYPYDPGYYPYDPYYTVINTGGAPVIIYPSNSYPSNYWDQSSVVIVDDYPVTVIPSIYTVTPEENPIPRDADDALVLLRRCWLERSPGLLWWLLPHNDYIDIVENGLVTSRMKAEDFYTVTSDAVNSVETEVFWFRSVERRGERVIASGVHTYRGSDDILRRCDMTYTFARRDGRWVIVETSFGPIARGNVVYRGLTRQESKLIFMKLSPMAIFAGFPNRAISLGAMCAIPFF